MTNVSDDLVEQLARISTDYPDSICGRALGEITSLRAKLAATEAKLEDEEANAARAWNAWETVTSRLEIARKALELLHLQQRGRAKALRLLNEARTISDPATLAQADAYEECGNELREALHSLNPDGDGK